MEQHTSDRSTKGGPSAISAALVPGRIRLEAPLSSVLNSFCCSSVPGDGLLGPSWISAMGGGLGRRGELKGEAVVAISRSGKVERGVERGVMRRREAGVGSLAVETKEGYTPLAVATAVDVLFLLKKRLPEGFL